MGKWHRPYQTALIIKKIQLDIDPKILYEYEFSLNWTEASNFDYYWDNLKIRILKLTGRNIYSFIKLDTINYRKVIEARNNYLLTMSKKNKNESTKEERRKLYDKFDKEDLWIINEALVERIEELEKEITKQKKVKSKCLTVFKINNKYNQYKKRFKKSLICNYIKLSRRTLNDKLNKKNLFIDRKVRKDAISLSPLLCSLVWESYEKSNGTYGQRRVHKDILNKGFSYSLSTVSSAMRRISIYANEKKVSHRKYEQKNTSIKTNYLVSKEAITNYNPGEAFSIDFSQIETWKGKAWLHGARDIVTGKILFIKFCYDQTSQTVLSHYKFLPNTTKVVNTDYGSSYLSSDVQSYLKIRDIKQSLGRVGCSYDNRWIEDLWKRIKYEWFTIYPTNNISEIEIINNIEKYIDFFNNRRLSKFSGTWDIPINLEKKYKINSGQII